MTINYFAPRPARLYGSWTLQVDSCGCTTLEVQSRLGEGQALEPGVYRLYLTGGAGNVVVRGLHADGKLADTEFRTKP